MARSHLPLGLADRRAENPLDRGAGRGDSRGQAPPLRDGRRYGRRPVSLGPVFSVGVHILDILGRPVDDIPPGQGSVLLQEIKATAAGTAAGPSVDLARLGV